jgi:hypothetical protein
MSIPSKGDGLYPFSEEISGLSSTGITGKVKFEARIKGLVENFRDLAVLVEPLLIVWHVLREHMVILHRRLFCWPSSGMMKCAGA